MPISSLVITYADENEGSRATELLTRDPRIELGQRVGLRQAAVVETATHDEDKGLWDWMNQLPGVTHIDVVFVSLIDDAPSRGSQRCADRAAQPSGQQVNQR